VIDTIKIQPNTISSSEKTRDLFFQLRRLKEIEDNQFWDEGERIKGFSPGLLIKPIPYK